MSELMYAIHQVLIGAAVLGLFVVAKMGVPEEEVRDEVKKGSKPSDPASSVKKEMPKHSDRFCSDFYREDDEDLTR